MSTTPTPPRGAPLLVAGLDAPAGGLVELEDLFGTFVPSDRTAFVVRADAAQCAASLRDRTRLPVVPVVGAVDIRPGHVYLVSPGVSVRIEGGRLHPAGPEPASTRPLDGLLEALAASYGRCAAAVIPAGPGHDGAVGARAVEEAGGLVVVYGPGREGAEGVPAVRRSVGSPTPASESERRLAAIFAHAAAGLCELSLDGRFLRVNDALCRMLGRTRESLLAASVPDVTYPPDRPASERALAHVRETGAPASVDKRYERADGTIVWASSSLTRLDDEQGRPAAVLAVTVDLTERRRAEHALRESEERLRLATEAAQMGVWAFDVETRTASRSPRFYEIYGYTPDPAGATLDDFYDHVHPDDRGRVREAVAATLRDGRRYREEFRIVRPDGEVRWVHSEGQLTRDEAGAPVRVAGVTYDVTERKRGEVALRERGERLALLTDAAATLLRGAEAADLLRGFYDRLAALIGMEVYSHYTVSPGGGALLLAASAGVDDPAFERVAFGDGVCGAAATRREPVVRNDVQETDDDGVALARSIGLAAYASVPLLDGERVLGTVGFGTRGAARFSDETLDVVRTVADYLAVAEARRQAEAALRESEARFREAADTVPDVLFTATPDGLVDYVSARLAETTGATPDDVYGTPIWPHLLHPDDRGPAQLAWAAARRGERVHEDRHRLRCVDGAYRWHLARARPIRGADGAVARWFGTCTDIDALVRAEHEVQALNATLEARVEERTHELIASEARVRSLARDLAVAEQEERRRIALVLHDDLQQQLYGLGITLSLLRRPQSPEEADRLHDQATEVLDGAAALTRSLSAELSPPALSAPRLATVLRSIAEKHRAQFGVAVNVEVEGDPHVQDHHLRVMLYQTVRELLFNTVKHAHAETVRLHTWDDERGAHVCVEDDGVGFDVGAVTDPEAGPRGLGLHTLQERAELVGAQIAFDSRPGNGTRVTISLPRPSEPEGEG